jgi:predicted nucleic-acid-binding protein
MLGLDTNVLARYYVAADGDDAAQRSAAQRLIDSGQPLMVCKTVVLELEWVLRGYYGFSQAAVASVIAHLLGLAHVTVEDRESVTRALAHQQAGIDFADALHHASYHACSSMASFDDRKFARRAKKLGMKPAVVVPTGA